MARKRWATARLDACYVGSGATRPQPTAANSTVFLVCPLCGREAKAFGYTHQLRSDLFPSYRFCSMECCNKGGALARRTGGMINKTSMEKQAIKEARRSFAEALVDLGLLASFYDRTSADIDRIIEACVDGFQASIRRQAYSLDNSLPF